MKNESYWDWFLGEITQQPALKVKHTLSHKKFLRILNMYFIEVLATRKTTLWKRIMRNLSPFMPLSSQDEGILWNCRRQHIVGKKALTIVSFEEWLSHLGSLLVEIKTISRLQCLLWHNLMIWLPSFTQYTKRRHQKCERWRYHGVFNSFWGIEDSVYVSFVCFEEVSSRLELLSLDCKGSSVESIHWKCQSFWFLLSFQIIEPVFALSEITRWHSELGDFHVTQLIRTNC